jgi:hypothetical protein
MTTVIKKSRLGYEDVNFDITGTGETTQVPTSDGKSRTVHKINSSHVPVTTAVRGESSTNAVNVSDCLSEVYDKLKTFVTKDTVIDMNNNAITNLPKGTATGQPLTTDQIDNTTIELNLLDELQLKDNSVTTEKLADILDLLKSKLVKLDPQSNSPADDSSALTLFAKSDGSKVQVYAKRPDNTETKLSDQSTAFNTPDFESSWITISSGTGWQDIAHSLNTTKIAIIKVSVRQNSGSNNGEFIMYPSMSSRGKFSEYETIGISVSVKDVNNISVFPAVGSTQNHVAFFLGASSLSSGAWTSDLVSSAQFKFFIWTHN